MKNCRKLHLAYVTKFFLFKTIATSKFLSSTCKRVQWIFQLLNMVLLDSQVFLLNQDIIYFPRTTPNNTLRS